MKRGGPLKRTPLTRKAPFRGGGGLAATTPANPPARKQRNPIRKVSAKRQRANQHRAKVVAHMRSVQDWCSMCGNTGQPLDAHELKSRAQGGSIIDPENIVLLDRLCHTWVTEHPREAAELGWAISRKWDRKTDFWEGHERPDLHDLAEDGAA